MAWGTPGSASGKVPALLQVLMTGASPGESSGTPHPWGGWLILRRREARLGERNDGTPH